MRTVPMLDLRREYDYMKEDIDRAIARCLGHQQWILGPEVKELEENIARYLGTRHCIGTSSGTEALVLSLRALAIKLRGKEYFDKSDEIITTPLTFTATGDAILRSGATPVFVDIDPRTYNIDPARVGDYLSRKSASDGGKSGVVGIVPVHLYGRPCDMDRIMEIAARHDLFVLEDTAQAFGGTWEDKKLGSIGICGAFSFFPSKNLGAFGDAGMVCTNDDELSDLVRMLLKHGGRDKYNVDHVGYNGRLDTLQAAILLAKFRHIDELNRRRRLIAEAYSSGLGNVPEVVLPEDGTAREAVGNAGSLPLSRDGHVFHQYTIAVRDGLRDKLRVALQERGVSTMVYYPVPLHKMRVFGDGQSISGGSLSNADAACSSVLSLPVGPFQTAQETEYVIEQIVRFFGA